MKSEEKKHLPPWFIFLARSRPMVVNESYHYDPKTLDPVEHVLVEVGGCYKEWPPIIGSYGSHNPQIFRSDVIEMIESRGLTGLNWSPVDIYKVKAKSMKSVPPPRYYRIWSQCVLETETVLWADVESQGILKPIRRDLYTEEIEKEYYEAARSLQRKSITRAPCANEIGTTDFFQYHPDPYFGIGCSFRFVELAREMKWKFVCAVIGHSARSPQAGMITELPWPPNEKWIAPNQELVDVLSILKDTNRERK